MAKKTWKKGFFQFGIPFFFSPPSQKSARNRFFTEQLSPFFKRSMTRFTQILFTMRFLLLPLYSFFSSNVSIVCQFHFFQFKNQLACEYVFKSLLVISISPWCPLYKAAYMLSNTLPVICVGFTCTDVYFTTRFFESVRLASCFFYLNK